MKFKIKISKKRFYYNVRIRNNSSSLLTKNFVFKYNQKNYLFCFNSDYEVFKCEYFFMNKDFTVKFSKKEDMITFVKILKRLELKEENEAFVVNGSVNNLFDSIFNDWHVSTT